MQIFKHRIFHRWARSEDLEDDLLKKAVDEMEQGLYEANLGSGLYKKRVAKKGRGKSGGYRILIAFKDGEKAFFIYGFAKNVLGNINDTEKKIYRNLSKDFLGMNDIEIKRMLDNKKLYEVKL